MIILRPARYATVAAGHHRGPPLLTRIETSALARAARTATPAASSARRVGQQHYFRDLQGSLSPGTSSTST